MNQAILFNDDLTFDKEVDAWRLTGMASGQLVTIYYHSATLKHTVSIDSCTKYDLEEITELWLADNEIEGDEIHLHI